MTRADREFLAGWTFGAAVIRLHLQDPKGRDAARGGIVQAVEGGYGHGSSDDKAGQAEAYLAAWGF